MNRTLISILGGLGGMFGWGTSDFFANITSEKIGHEKAFFWSQIAGAFLIVLFMLFLSPSLPSLPLIGLTMLGGVAYALGYLLFYKGLEIGNVSVVSTVVNLGVLFMIFISFFLRGQKLTALQVPAIILILLGIIIISVNIEDLKKGTVSLLRGVKETLLATIMFGALYWPLNEFVVEKANLLTVSLITKLTAVAFVFLISLFQKRSLIIKKTSIRLTTLVALVGILEAIAVLAVAYGLTYGDGIIVAPVSSALTIVTVGLAVIFLKEKLTKIQITGIAMVIVGIIMTAF